MPTLIRYLHTDHEKITESVALEALKEKVISRVTEFLQECNVSSDAKIWLTLGNEVSDQSHQIIEILQEHFRDRARVLTEYDLRWKTLSDVMQKHGLEVHIKVEQTIQEFDSIYWYDESNNPLHNKTYNT